MNHEQACDFLNSLGPEKGQPEEMHSQRFDMPLPEIEADVFGEDGGALFLGDWISYLLERCHRAESRNVPDLKEKVKEFGRVCMDAASKQPPAGHYDYVQYHANAKAWRALCAPEVKP